MEKVSVIVPVFNGEKYIENVLKQLLGQTYSELEVVFVNDGSSDGSARLLDEMHDSNNNVKVVHQENAGQGAARNRGIEESTGDYLLFMDQDDRIKDDYIEKLVGVAMRENCDMVISGYEHITESGEVKEHVELINNEWCRFMNITPWGKIYRRDFVIGENIRFLPVPLGEDIYFNVLCYSHAKKVSYTDYVGYQWVINEQSVSNTVHKKYSAKADILILFDKLIKMDTAPIWTKDDQFRYFVLKTGIFHILYAAKGTTTRQLLDYRTRIFAWLGENIPEHDNNSLIAWNAPVGERPAVRHAVFIFMLLRKLHLDGLFLRAFHVL